MGRTTEAASAGPAERRVVQRRERPRAAGGLAGGGQGGREYYCRRPRAGAVAEMKQQRRGARRARCLQRVGDVLAERSGSGRPTTTGGLQSSLLLPSARAKELSSLRCWLLATSVEMALSVLRQSKAASSLGQRLGPAYNALRSFSSLPVRISTSPAISHR